MDKKDLKTLIKPMIKECIREVLMEEGLAKILAEGISERVIKPASREQPVIQEQKQSTITTKRLTRPDGAPLGKPEPKKITEIKQELLKKMDKKIMPVKSFDPFAGTVPLTESQAAGTGGQIDPEDPGIDISGLIGNSNKILAALGSGKK